MTDNENGAALVKRGYNEPTRCLHFRIGFNVHMGDGAACALAALRAIGGYNAFDGEAAAQVIRDFAEAGDVLWTIEVGREFSPVVYLHVREDVVPEFRQVIENSLRDIRADELDWHGDTLRAWWD